MRTTINLPDDLLIRARQRAAASNRTLTAVIEEALRLALDRTSQTPAGGEVRLVTYGTGGVRPGVDLDDSAALLEVMERPGDPG